MKSNNKSLYLLGLFVVLGLVGCADPNDKLEARTPVAGKQLKEYVPSAPAGVYKDITKSLDPSRNNPYISSTVRFGRRNNPFALNADEKAFDVAQAAEKIFIEGGAFGSLYEVPEDRLPVAEPMEPQPYRRLSGILIGDSVLAILEEGSKSTIVRPGMMIPDTSWRVISIDRDRAILRREGSTRLPREVEVRLEVGLPFQGGNSGQGGAPQGGAPQGGPPPGGGRRGGGGVSSGAD
jgi:uncharacterized membrane protein YgcG